MDGAGGAGGGGGIAGTAEFKICLLGDRGVGKTCLVLRFIEGYFSQQQQSTIGAFFLAKTLTVNNVLCKLQIWDTAGQERFRAMAPMYYRNAAAAIVCCDITDEESFDKVRDWVEELRANVPEGGLSIVVALNKTDLEDRRVVSRARAEAFASSIGNAAVVETSAREGWGVEQLFTRACQAVLAAQPELVRPSPLPPSQLGGGGGVGLVQRQGGGWGYCC